MSVRRVQGTPPSSPSPWGRQGPPPASPGTSSSTSGVGDEFRLSSAGARHLAPRVLVEEFLGAVAERLPERGEDARTEIGKELSARWPGEGHLSASAAARVGLEVLDVLLFARFAAASADTPVAEQRGRFGRLAVAALDDGRARAHRLLTPLAPAEGFEESLETTASLIRHGIERSFAPT